MDLIKAATAKVTEHFFNHLNLAEIRLAIDSRANDLQKGRLLSAIIRYAGEDIFSNRQMLSIANAAWLNRALEDVDSEIATEDLRNEDLAIPDLGERREIKLALRMHREVLNEAPGSALSLVAQLLFLHIRHYDWRRVAAAAIAEEELLFQQSYGSLAVAICKQVDWAHMARTIAL